MKHDVDSVRQASYDRGLQGRFRQHHPWCCPVSEPPDPFEEVASSDRYEAAINRSLPISHVGHRFYVKAKADLLLEALSGHFGNLDGISVLDVGCGVGAVQEFVGVRVGRSVGIDTSEPSIIHAQAEHSTSEFDVYDGTRIPFDDDTFDATFAINVLHHVEPGDRERFTREMMRVTRVGGMVIVFEHNPFNPLTRMAVARCDFDDGGVLIGARGVSRLLESAGGTAATSRYVLFFPFDRAVARTVERWLGWLPMGAQHMVVAHPRDRTRGQP